MTGFMNKYLPVWVLLLGCCGYAAGVQADDYAEARHKLVQEIESHVRATSEYLTKQALDPRVMQAIATVPRQEFVATELRSYAYYNQPLPIGHGQTIFDDAAGDLADLPVIDYEGAGRYRLHGSGGIDQSSQDCRLMVDFGSHQLP